MPRLLVHVEGQTEETFVNEVLASHLYHAGYSIVSARLIGNARQRDHRGGIRGWNTVRKDILNHLKQDAGCIATVMVDYYGLPQSGEKAWPGRLEASRLPYPEKAHVVHRAIHADICEDLGEAFNPDRFIPYVMMHEFEALLFSDCKLFADGIGRPKLVVSMQQIRDQFATPEEINDSPVTAPSKRIIQLVPEYEKPLLGTLGILNIGLNAIRTECPLFHAWMTQLEVMAGSTEPQS